MNYNRLGQINEHGRCKQIYGICAHMGIHAPITHTHHHHAIEGHTRGHNLEYADQQGESVRRRRPTVQMVNGCLRPVKHGVEVTAHRTLETVVRRGFHLLVLVLKGWVVRGAIAVWGVLKRGSSMYIISRVGSRGCIRYVISRGWSGVMSERWF